MTLYDWLMLTSMACLIVMTACGVYLLNRLRKKLNQQTIEIQRSTEQLKTLPDVAAKEMRSSIDEIKGRVKLGWRIFTFIRRQRKKRKLKKRMMN